MKWSRCPPFKATLRLMGKGDKKGRGNEQYTTLTYAMLKSPAWRSLSGAALKVFFELHLRYNGGNNGTLVLSMNEAVQALGIGKATAQRAFQELEEKGFVELMKQGNWYHRAAHEWRITHKRMETTKGKIPPTMDWRNYQPPPKTTKKKQKSGSDTDPSRFSIVPFENPEAESGTI